jgi:hypothetical protein
MNWRRALGLGGVALISILPSYIIERITDYYFLTNNPVFFTWSGDRTWLFIISILVGAIIAGSLFKTLSADLVASYVAGIAVLLSLLYHFCNPQVCYSTGFDDLEPLRVAYFFSCVAIAGISIGCYARTRHETTGKSLLVVRAATVGAIAYYPVIFTVAGARLLSPFSPFPALAVVALLSFGIAATMTHTCGMNAGVGVTVLSNVVLMLVAIGIAREYFIEILPVAASFLAAGIISALLGGWLGSASARSPSCSISRRLTKSNAPALAALLLVLLMTIVFTPDATASVIPKEATGQSTSPYVFGTTVYAGGFMTQSFLRLKGVSVRVSFAGTNASSIQLNNFLSGGIGIHSPHCCVDGIDFGYRFDVYLFHDGSEMLAAEAWMICDWNMACGGHSWQNLMFFRDEKITASVSSDLQLYLEWKNRTVVWSYSVNQGPLQNFTSFVPPTVDNPYFNIGTLGSVPSSPEPPSVYFPFQTTGFYFFQYGLMSAYPIGHGGWSVSFVCPSYLTGTNDDWKCVQHSDSVQGDKGYWKAIWRWGQPYSNVIPVVERNGTSPAVTFSYSPSSTMPSFESLW